MSARALAARCLTALPVCALVLAAWAAGSAMAGAPPSARASAVRVPCRPQRGTSTIAHSRGARIFSDARTGDDYACLYSNGRARYLSTTEHWEYALARFAGHYVAFVAFANSVNAYVGVMNLLTGHVRRFREYEEVAPVKPAAGECPSAVPDCSVVCPQVDSLVLGRDGALAWIATNFPAPTRTGGPFCASAIAPIIEVRSYDRRGLRVIGGGPGVAPRSLRLTGSTLSWMSEGRRVSSTLL